MSVQVHFKDRVDCLLHFAKVILIYEKMRYIPLSSGILYFHMSDRPNVLQTVCRMCVRGGNNPYHDPQPENSN